MYQKIYIHADNLQKPWDLETFHFLFEETDPYKIWQYSLKMGKSQMGRIFDVAVLEIFLFYCYLKNQGYKKEQIEILQDFPLFIKNDDLYKIENGQCIELQTKNIWFFSLRATNWKHPFFYILHEIIKKKWGKMKRTNNTYNLLNGKWKFFWIHALYKYRKKFLWDIIIPYKINKANVEVWREFIMNNFSSRIVIKNDYSCAGKWVFIIDLEQYDTTQQTKFLSQFEKFSSFLNWVYITPYYDFNEEYRFYFTKQAWKIQIFSFKKKKILSNFQEIVQADSFQYYKNIKISWEYVENKDWKKYSDILEIGKKYIQKLRYTTGTLEFWKTKDNKIIFFEVNSMSATLCYEWEDEKNLNDFYTDIYNEILYK